MKFFGKLLSLLFVAISGVLLLNRLVNWAYVKTLGRYITFDQDENNVY